MSKDSEINAASPTASNILFWNGRIGPVFYFGTMSDKYMRVNIDADIGSVLSELHEAHVASLMQLGL